MRQRGRRSAASLVDVNVTGAQPRLTPPKSLTGPERELFLATVNACAPAQFRQSDMPLLLAYVQSAALAQKLVGDEDKLAAWEKAVKLMATLATRLRLSPQSRADPKTIGRQDNPDPWLRKPWLDK